MVSTSQHTLIKELQAQGLGPSAIADRLGRDRKTVRQYLAREDCSPAPPVRGPRPSPLDPYVPGIQRWLDDDRHTFSKQHHTAQRIWERVHAEYPAFPGSYSLVQRYVKGLRVTAPTRGPRERVWHLGACQGDFGTAEVVWDGAALPCKYLTVSCPYSNAGYLPLFGGETAECLITGLQAVFTRWGTGPRRCVFDNASGVGRQGADTVRLTELFQRFPAPYRGTVTLCNPYSGHAQGAVENKVGYRRRPRRVPPPAVTDGAATNAALLDRCEADWVPKGGPLAARAADDRSAGAPSPGPPATRFAT